MKALLKRRITVFLVLILICTWCTGFYAYADTAVNTTADNTTVENSTADKEAADSTTADKAAADTGSTAGDKADSSGTSEEKADENPQNEAKVTPAPAALVSKPGKDAKIKKGYYYFKPACSKKRVMSVASKSKAVNANIRLNLNKNADYQTFYIKPSGNGTYLIKNKNSGLYLAAKNEGTAKKTNVCQTSYSSSNSLKWYITKKKGMYVIQSAISKNVLSVVGSKDKNKQNIYLNTNKKKKGQKWELIRFKKASGKWKQSGRVWKGTAEDYKILGNIIGAIESGDQIYANLNYGAYDPPYKNSPNEHTITLGWPQCYGPEAQELLKNIYKKDKKSFNKIDKVLPKGQRIVNYINRDITSMRWNPNSKQRKVIIKLLKSKAGKACQDAQFKKYMKEFVNDCLSSYTRNAWAVVMYCQIRHLGGKNAATRIFSRCGGDYSLNKIMSVLKQDQYDGRSNYQVGDRIFWSRHECVCTFLETYM